MKRGYKYMILALVGFGLGALVAFFQVHEEVRKSQGVVVDAAGVRAIEDRPDVEAADRAVSAAAEDVTVSEQAPPAEGTLAADTRELAAAEDPHAAHRGMQDHQDHMAATDAPAETPDAAPVVAGAGVGGAFSLIDHNGMAVTNESWPGKYKLVFFGFTHCPDICPAALDKMTTALNTLGDKAEMVQPLLITIDPARDDAATLKAYVSNYHPSIVGLTGSEEQLKQAENAYKVYAAKTGEGENYTMAHSSFIFLMSPADELLEIIREDEPADAAAQRIAARLDAAQ